MNRKHLFFSVVGLIVLVFVMATVLYRNHSATQQGKSVSQNQSVVERKGAASKDPVDARVTIVEFLDPACGTCRDFYPLIEAVH